MLKAGAGMAVPTHACRHDDAVNAISNSVVRQVTDGFKNPNGCNMPATW